MGQMQYAIATVFGMVTLTAAKRYLDGADVWLMSSERKAFAMILTMALIMCSFGIQMAVATGAFTKTPFIIGGLIGLPVLIVSILIFAGKTPPVIGTVCNAIVALCVVIAVKWGIVTIHLISRLLQTKG